MNHYSLYIQLMNGLVTNAVLCVHEFWFDTCMTRVRWGNAVSSLIALNNNNNNNNNICPTDHCE